MLVGRGVRRPRDRIWIPLEKGGQAGDQDNGDRWRGCNGVMLLRVCTSVRSIDAN